MRPTSVVTRQASRAWGRPSDKRLCWKRQARAVVIVTDACASDAGPEVHDAGLLVARRLIGTGQLVDVEHVMGQLDTRVADPVLE